MIKAPCRADAERAAAVLVSAGGEQGGAVRVGSACRKALSLLRRDLRPVEEEISKRSDGDPDEALYMFVLMGR